MCGRQRGSGGRHEVSEQGKKEGKYKGGEQRGQCSTCMKHILIIDGNNDILASIQNGLASRLKDCRILTALNCEQGEQILKSETVDLIVADLEMPVANGYRFIESVRHELPSIPVCVTIGSCPAGVVERLRMLGVARIIGKPFLMDHLADVIAEELSPEKSVFSPGTPGIA